MSKIITRSAFYFNTVVTSSNYAIDFSEGGAEIKASLEVGDYSLTEYAAEIQRALRAAGTQLYTVTLNRTTRVLTIAAPSNFELKCNTGSRAGVAAWTIMGFSTAADRTGANSYAGNSGAGSEYLTQYPVDKYLDPAHSIVFENATYNVTPIGIGQQVSFGDGYRIEMDIRLITNQNLVNQDDFYYNASGIANFLTFIRYVLAKNRAEFMPDIANRSSFYKVVLEKTADDGSGRAFKLKNMKTPEIYHSGDLLFRGVLT